jgi:hypothetical protein
MTVVLCAHGDCTNEARMAIMTSRPSRDNLYSKVWYDDRDEKIPKKAEKLCKEHGIQTLTELSKVLVSDDVDTLGPTPTDTQQKGTT